VQVLVELQSYTQRPSKQDRFGFIVAKPQVLGALIGTQSLALPHSAPASMLTPESLPPSIPASGFSDTGCKH
jgi:hypothetical protein